MNQPAVDCAKNYQVPERLNSGCECKLFSLRHSSYYYWKVNTNNRVTNKILSKIIVSGY